MEKSAMEVITERLSSMEGLYFPRAFLNEAPDPSRRKTALLDILSRDAPLFLERYGSDLTVEELREFETINGDYEVEWHLNRLRTSMNPTAQQARLRSVTVKNRRRAYLEQLTRGGVYFSEEAMREREPYLHHQYLGRFQDPAGRRMSRPGERWSETLMRRSEEAILLAKIRGEQQRLGIPFKDWVGNEEEEEEEELEEEEEEEEEEEDDGVEGPSAAKVQEDNGGDSNGAAPQAVSELRDEAISSVDLQDQLEHFTLIMHQKFLAGEDSEHVDYAVIDNNERLDDHWLKESSHDAEEKYFAED